MKYDKSILIRDFYNEPVTGLRGPTDTEAATFGDLFVSCCGLGLPNDGPEEKLRTYKLGLKLLAPDNFVDLTDTETVRLRTLVSRLFNPLLVGRVEDYLNAPVAEH